MIIGSLIQAVLGAECEYCESGVEEALPPQSGGPRKKEAIKATPDNDDVAVPENPNLKVPVVELDPAPHEKPEENRKDETLRLNEKGVGTITQTDIFN